MAAGPPPTAIDSLLETTQYQRDDDSNKHNGSGRMCIIDPLVASIGRLSNIKWRRAAEIELFVVVIVGGDAGSSLCQ